MTTLGDVWAITAAIVGIAACAWALLLCMSLFFVRRTEAAKERIEEAPYKLIALGLIAVVLIGGAGIVLLSVAFPVAKLIGWMLLLWLMAVSFTGSAGLVRIAGERISQLDSRLSPYGAMSRGAMFLVLPSILPILGWFLFAPVIFCLGVGAGLRVMRQKEAAISTGALVS
jgi:hypothetical protein